MPAGSRASTAASIRVGERRDRLTNPRLAAHTPATKKAPPKRQPFFGGVNLIFRINSTTWPFSTFPDTAVIALTTLTYLRV